MTPRDEAGLKSARSPSAADSPSGRYPLAAITTAGSVRHRYVVGIFAAPSGAYGAVKGLSPDSCDVLVVLSSAPGDADGATQTDGRVIVHNLDTSEALTTKLAAALDKLTPFADLGSGAREPDGEAAAPPGPLRLFQNIVHHLAAGAAVVVVHVPDSERQLKISRALLDARCDVLLTHDVLQTAGCGPSGPTEAEDCCQDCTSQACRRIDPLPNGTARARE